MNVSAQKHEFSFDIGGGMSTIRFQGMLDYANRNKWLSIDYSNGSGIGDFGLGYTYLFNKNIGIHTGVGFGYYTGKATLDGIYGIYALDMLTWKEIWYMEILYQKYTEKIETLFINIPIMVQFQKQRIRGIYYVMSGVKIGVPFWNDYSSTPNSLIIYSSLYPDNNNSVTLNEVKDKNFDGIIDFGLSYMFALDAGMKWKINDMFSLYTGVYFDLGLNNIIKNKYLPFYDYDVKENPSNLNINGFMLSLFTEKDVNTLALGVKLRLGF